MFEEVAQEPVPDDFNLLLEQIDRKDRKEGGNS